MNDLHLGLRDGDPAGSPDDQALSPEQVVEMRRRILNAAARLDVVRTPWQQPLAVVAMVALTIAAGVIAGMRFAPVTARPSAPSAAEPVDGRRQFQFSTPGGTRIIWVFDPEFQVKETVP